LSNGCTSTNRQLANDTIDTMTERIPRVHPMLASLVPKPFHLPGWVYEEKYDGYRILAYKESSKVTLLSRNDLDRTATFATVAGAIGQLRDRSLLLDGEVIALDSKGVSRFQLLQRGDVAQHYAVFDCVYRNGRELRSEPLSHRRQELEIVLAKASKTLLVSRRLAKNGLASYDIAKRKGFEGVVAKDNDSPYEERRSRKWLKVKVHQEEEFVIGGFTAPEGSRLYIGALLLGAYRGKDLHFVGKVGTGFTEKTLTDLAKKLKPLVIKSPPFVDPPREKNVTWLAPRLVAQIAFQEWTADRKLRQPVFLGLRDDKQPTECIMPENP
jgi:bifunctional non-homologous end joining protein LigD